MQFDCTMFFFPFQFRKKTALLSNCCSQIGIFALLYLACKLLLLLNWNWGILPRQFGGILEATLSIKQMSRSHHSCWQVFNAHESVIKTLDEHGFAQWVLINQLGIDRSRLEMKTPTRPSLTALDSELVVVTKANLQRLNSTCNLKPTSIFYCDDKFSRDSFW